MIRAYPSMTEGDVNSLFTLIIDFEDLFESFVQLTSLVPRVHQKATHI